MGMERRSRVGQVDVVDLDDDLQTHPAGSCEVAGAEMVPGGQVPDMLHADRDRPSADRHIPVG